MAAYIVLLGPPGAGKGTHAKIMCKRYQIPHISTGDLLRSGIRNETPLGKRAKTFVESGKLVPDELVIDMTEERLGAQDIAKGFLLDGFPRTVEQALALEKMLERQKRPINVALEFALSEDIVVVRLSGRRACPKCGTNYHIKNIPPKKEGICDNDGTELIHRRDDKPETVKDRLEVYHRQTAPLIDFYKQRGLHKALDAGRSIEALQEQIAQIVKAL
jgi:adenylate kinase